MSKGVNWIIPVGIHLLSWAGREFVKRLGIDTDPHRPRAGQRVTRFTPIRMAIADSPPTASSLRGSVDFRQAKSAQHYYPSYCSRTGFPIK